MSLEDSLRVPVPKPAPGLMSDGNVRAPPRTRKRIRGVDAPEARPSGGSEDELTGLKASSREDVKKKFRFDDDFTVLVGADEVRFVIYKDVFSHQSDFFRAACSHDFKETKEKVVRLPEVEPEVFRSYMQWAYRGEVVVQAPIDQVPPLSRSRQLLLGELYTLANFLGDMGLKNAVIDQFAAMLKDGSELAIDFVNHLYGNTPESCKLRKFILACFLHAPKGQWLKTNRAILPSAFLVDIAIESARFDFDRTTFINPHNKTACLYHELGKAPTCSCADCRIRWIIEKRPLEQAAQT